MKRKIALLVAVVLVLGAGFSVYAMGVAGTTPTGQESASDGLGAPAEAGNDGTVVSDGTGTPGSGTEAEETDTPSDSGAGDNTVQPGGDGTQSGDGEGTGDGAQSGDGEGTGDGTQSGDGEGTGDGAQSGDDEGTGDGTQSGDDEGTGDGTQDFPDSSNPEDVDTGNNVEGSDQPVESTPGSMGQLDVSLGAALTLGSNASFTVSLKGDEYSQTKNITLKKEEADTGTVSFQNLREGGYTLTVSGRGFADYTQSISIKKDTGYAVSLMTGFVSSDKIVYEKGFSHPGVLLIGDVNGDGGIDETDRQALVDVIEGRSANAYAADLNCDGTVDLVDLEYFTKGYGETRDTQATVETFVPAAAITASGGNNTKTEDNVENLLTKTGSVRLQPQNGQAISKSNPVTVEFDLTQSTVPAEGIIIKTGDNTSGAGNPISTAELEITYMDESGNEQTEKVSVTAEGLALLAMSSVVVSRDANGNIWIDLGAQVAVKKVTLTITGMQKSTNLAEISSVEFVNDMENRIPEPQMDIPEKLSATAGNKKITVTWDPCVNVTGYEVKISQGGKSETVMVTQNAYTVTSFGGKELVNYNEYEIAVQSVNGTWRSGYCTSQTATPLPTGKPDKPDNVSAAGGYRSVVVSWKQMKDTLSYNVYYRKVDESSFQKIEGITDRTSYTIMNLEDLTEYVVYVTGENEFGESGPSLQASARTTDLNPAVMTKYNLINIGEEGEIGAHIKSATMNKTMKDSPLDTEPGTAWGTVDKDPVSHYYAATWDTGGFNYMDLNNGLTYEFDEAYKMDTFSFYDLTSMDTGLFYVRVRYWDEEGNQKDGNASWQRKTDANGKIYYVVKLAQPDNIKKLQFGLARYSATGTITVSEVYFYYYDTLTDEVMALYADDLHVTLKPEVTQETIDALRVKINTVDPVSGEYHPDRELLEIELQNAEALLNSLQLSEVISIHNGITTKGGYNVGGLNAWQPLGVVAAAQEEIMVYVGHSSKKTGETTDLELIATQYHSESGAMSASVGKLKVGANKITVPKIGSLYGVEGGGALYVQYSGDSEAAEQYAVRVSGGVKVPRLDLYQVDFSSTEGLNRISAYIEELDAFVGSMQAIHSEYHMNSANSQVHYVYDAENCILGATDIMMNTMMYSLPAQQILAGLGSGSTAERAKKMANSLQAMEDMLYLFYQHKGLNSSAANAIDQIPKGHLNIRYQRMFSGAFMYASGNHIGIEWGSATGMMTAVPVKSDSDGRYQSGVYFGWGIAHEIGHCINQGAYTVPEITNNYYSQLAQAKDTNTGMRWDYDNVYKKVTSGTTGRADMKTQIAVYWQLHLAYDSGYNYKTYSNYEEQLANLFFARVDTYARTTSKAPSPGGVTLTLPGDTDQNLMRLACAAAEKNILEYFERWGMIPDAGTIAYAEQFEKETRAIYYVSDDSRVYALSGGGSVLGTEGEVEAVADTVTASVNKDNANQVNFVLASKNIPASDVLGYEIVRCTVSGGETEKTPVGFTTQSTWTDTVYLNNRMVWYEITVVDKYLNRSAVKTLEPVKISNDGSQEKAFWTISTTNLTAEGEIAAVTNNGTLCTPETENPADVMIDDNAGTIYNAAATGRAEILLEFNQTLTVAGFKYTSGDNIMHNYEIQVLTEDGWKTAATGSFADGVRDTVHASIVDADTGATEERELGRSTIYFANEDQKYVGTYEATALKLILTSTTKGSPVSIGELDVLGVTGDNVDFRRTDGTAAIGVLGTDYKYGKESGQVIPAGSVVFTGTFKGNPAYNVLILFDQDGNVVGGTDGDGALNAYQIILADVPADGNIQDVYDGTWIYWIEPDQNIDLTGISQVRAELYRVNNASTNEGQRLVGDTLFEDMPKTLPEINFSSTGQ